MRHVLACLLVTACATTPAMDDDRPDDEQTEPQGEAPPACVTVTDAAPVAIGTASVAEEHALSLHAWSTSPTKWNEAGNEALVLEVRGARGLIGHLVLHQGATEHDYTMHLGALAAGEEISVQVSTLSATNAVRSACLGTATLTPASAMGDAAEGMLNAPEFRWPVQKRFDDLPVVLGWSKARKTYQTLFTSENGGTVAQCGGGASGIQAEIARWGRAHDIEGSYAYGGTMGPRWERCTGMVPTTTTAVRMEAAHPRLYYGDGHNRLFESRGGYGQTCGSAGDEKPNGDLTGWNVGNTSNQLANDDGHVIILRPLPVDMDALGFAQFGDRREALADRYAPWAYRLTSLELTREGRLDGNKALSMSRYLYVDVRVSDVGGSGDQYCAILGVSGGFRLRAFTTANEQIEGPQVTSDYASGGAHDYKRVAIPLPAGLTAADIDHFTFDAYDDDGIYLTAIGDAFIPVADGPNGATIEYVRKGVKALSAYVDDGRSGCVNGFNSSGPGGTAYECVGGQVAIAK